MQFPPVPVRNARKKEYTRQGMLSTGGSPVVD